MAEPDKQMFRTHRELGEDLIRQYPDTYGGENPYLLGKRYEEKYPDEVGIEEAGGFFSSARHWEDFLRTSGEVVKGGADLIAGVGGDIVDVAALPFSRVDEIAAGDIEGAKRFPFIRSLAGLGQGAAADLWQQFAGAIGLPEETIGKATLGATPAEQRAGRDVTAEFQESFEDYAREERPMEFLANLSAVTPGKTLTKVAPKAAQRALGADADKVQQVAETVREVGRVADPTNVLSTLAKAGRLGATKGYPLVKRSVDPVKKFVKRGTTRGRNFAAERAEDIVAFTTSTGNNAIRRLAERAGESPLFRNKVRAWRRLPQERLYSRLYTTFNNAVRKVREKSQNAYELAEDQLKPILSKPLSEAQPRALEDLQGELRTIIEQFQGVVRFEAPKTKVVKGPARGGFDADPTTLRAEDYATPYAQPGGRYVVDFTDAEIIPTATGDLKQKIAREFERFLNMDSDEITGLDIHKLRKNLDRTIDNMPGGGAADDIYRGPFRVRTELRSALSNALETAYGEKYKEIMADYRAYAEMQRTMYNTFKLTGTDVDKKSMETILGELANTYNPNARQGLRPGVIQEFAEMAEMPDLEAALLGATFNPSISKGLAQRSEMAENVATILGGAAGMEYGGGAWPAAMGALGARVATQAAQQLLYSPRLFSEALMTFYDLPSMPSTRKVTQLREKLTSNPKVNAILREGLPLGVTLERIKNEAGVDAYDILATEEEASPNLFKSLSRGAQ